MFLHVKVTWTAEGFECPVETDLDLEYEMGLPLITFLQRAIFFYITRDENKDEGLSDTIAHSRDIVIEEINIMSVRIG